MSWWDRVRRAYRELTSAPSHQDSTDIDAYLSGWTDLLGQSGAFKKLRSPRDAASRDTYVRRAMEIIIGQVAGLSLQVVDKEGKEVSKGFLAERVLASPNERQGWYEFWGEAVGWWLTEGRVVWMPEKAANGHVVALYNLSACHVYPEINEFDYRNPIKSFRYNHQKYSPEELIYLYWWTPSGGYKGESPLKAALEDVATSVAISRAIRSLSEGGMKANTILAAKQILTPADVEKVQKILQDKYEGPDKAGKTPILTAPFDLLNRTVTPEEAQLIQVKEAIRQSTLAATGISEILLISGVATYENQMQAKRILWELTLLPLVRRFEDVLTQRVAATYDKRLRIRFDLSGVDALKPAWSEIGQASQALADIMSPNERRRDILSGVYVPLLEGGDEIRKQGLSEVIAVAPPVESKKGKKRTSIAEAWDVLTGKQLKDEKSEEPLSNGRLSAGGLSAEQRQYISQAVDMLLTSYERTFAKRAARAFKAQEKRVVAYLEELDDDLSNLAAVEEWINWGEIKASKVTGERKIFTTFAHNSITAAVRDAGQRWAAERKGAKFEMTREHKKEITERAQEYADSVTITTVERLKRAVEKAKRAGQDAAFLDAEEEELPEEAPEETKKGKLLAAVAALYLWSHTGTDGRQSRAEAGAQREMHGAISYGRHAAMEQNGVLKRQVIAFLDGRERSWHADWDGQIVPINQPFISGIGNEVMHLGWSGIPEEDANCRCTEAEVREYCLFRTTTPVR